MRKSIIARRISQAFFFILLVYILWSTTYPLKGVLPPETFFKADPLIMFITSISQRLILSGIIFSLMMVLLAFILGRFFCGWVCPLGTIIDMAGLETKHSSLSDSVNKRLSRPKFFLLAAVFILALFGIQTAWVFDPIVIMARFISLNLIPTVTLVLDGIFSGLIKTFNLYGPFYDFYRGLKSSLLGVQVHYFSHSLIILLFFLLIIRVSQIRKRFWCRSVCPLGAIYALVSNFSLLRRKVDKCSNCKKCKSSCRMGAIKDDLSYVKGECILCMDCIYDCPQQVTSFKFASSMDNKSKNTARGSANGITRRNFLVLSFVSLSSLFGFAKPEERNKRALSSRVIRPPAALKEDEFLDRCIRCGNCMKVCITNGLQPVLFQSGFSGIWTPQLVPEIGYCEYHCTLCGNVCPTGAIPRLSLKEKQKVRLGLAKIDRSICLPWKDKKECIVCEEHCPIPNKAIKLKRVEIDGKIILRPYMNLDLCTGCGICQTKCPTRPNRAIKIYPVRQTRTKSRQIRKTGWLENSS
jgi:MauM/NapG family ferredoxin protein